MIFSSEYPGCIVLFFYLNLLHCCRWLIGRNFEVQHSQSVRKGKRNEEKDLWQLVGIRLSSHKKYPLIQLLSTKRDEKLFFLQIFKQLEMSCLHSKSENWSHNIITRVSRLRNSLFSAVKIAFWKKIIIFSQFLKSHKLTTWIA